MNNKALENRFHMIEVGEIENAFERIGKDWMLITAADKDGKVNAMTASWGCMGVLWNKNIAVCFIRPQRYSYGLVEDSERISLAFFGGTHREALGICGRLSGRDNDKLALSGLTDGTLDGVPAIAEAELVLVCRKIYCDDIKPECFIDKSLLSHYKNDYHRIYVCEIEKAYRKN